MSEFFRAKFPEEPPPGWIRSHIRDGITEVSSPLVMRDDEIYRLVSVRRRHGGMFDRERLPGRKILTKDLSRAVPGAFVVAKRQVVHGATCLVPSEMADAALASSYAQFLGTERCDIDFFARLAQHPAMTNLFYDASQGVVVEKLTLSVPEWLGYKVNLPPLPEQRAIAAVLDTIDDAIQKTEQIIAKLQQVKQGLLHDLLTRGIDDNGELRDPDRHPEQFQDSPLGRIPKGWHLVRLRDVATKIADRDHTTPRYVDDGVLMVSPTNLSGEEDIDFIACRRIPLIDHRENRKKTDIEVGDLIIHRIGAGLGAIREVNDSMPEFSILHSMAMIRIARSRAAAAFVRWALRSSAVQGQMGLGTQSIGVPDLGLDKIGSLEFYLPENSEQLAIASVLDTFVRRIEAEAVAREKLQHMRRGLSDDLLTGCVRTTSLPEFSA